MNAVRSLLVMSMIASSACVSADDHVTLEFIGEETFPTGHNILGTHLGGLSGIDYDKQQDTYVAISDDRAQLGKARFYDLSIDLSDGFLNAGDITFTAVTEILDRNGESFPAASLDPESIRIKGFPNLLYWTSEGDANKGIAPFVRVMTRDGHFVDEFTTPEKYVPSEGYGIRNNQAFESLTFSHNGNHVYTATEGALIQDGPAASTDTGSPVRVLQLNGKTGEPMKEFIYETDPVIDAPVPAGAFSTNGLVELLAVSPNYFVAVERSFSVGVGNSIRLYVTTTEGASNVKRVDSISKKKHLRTMKKYLLMDLAELGIALDNIEGITLGPDLPGGEKSLILVSDNNFNPNGQFTQFLAFKIHGF